MQRDIALDTLQHEQIDHWLIGWHKWSASVRDGAGYPGTAAGCGMYRASRQYDDGNGAMDLAADIAEAKAVDGVISRMDAHHKAALHIEARNLCSARVWSSPRVDREQLAILTQDARRLLWLGMVKEGLA